MNFLSPVKAFSQSRLSWLLLFAFSFAFLLCALYFQHGMNLEPCVMCIYERVAMISIGLAALIGMVKPKNTAIRWLGLAAWGASAYKGMMLAIEHVGYQTNIFATCEPLIFPDWAPLNKWVPWYFEAPGNCSEVVWQFMTLSMPQWLVIIFAGNLVALALVVLSQFAAKK